MAAVPAPQWDALLARQARPTPFMRHAYLHALEASESACGDTGWHLRLLTVNAGAELVAACPVYLKTHSYGEYVFDWSWASAYRRHGLDYYPKALTAVPFTPVPGTRLLATGAPERALLIGTLVELVRSWKLSSAHVLFIDETERAALADAGWMMRRGVQFHWQQDAADPTPSLEAMLARLVRDKRKKIQQERRRVTEAGIAFTVHEGAAIDEGLWDFFHHCYTQTYRAHHSTPYLTREFFRLMARDMAPHWVLFVARDPAGQPVACSLIAVDREASAAWGRYWGAVRHVSCLHFDACYYQPLDWCMRNGIARFEGGAQGEHKMARGLMPVDTWSAHQVADPRFSRAIGDAVAEEAEGIGLYVDELRDHSPFRKEGAP